MKVLVIAGGFLPAKKYGGPVVSINNLCTLLKDNAEMYVVANDHEMGETNRFPNITEGWNILPNCKVNYLRDTECNYEKFKSIVEEINPDLVYVNSLFDGKMTLPFLRIAKEKGTKVLLAVRGQLCAGAFKKKYKKLPYIFVLRGLGLLNNVFYQSTSEEETECIQKWLGVKENKIFFLNNVPSIPDKKYERVSKSVGNTKILYLSRIVAKKNLLYALECLKSVKGSVQFDIFGPQEDLEYWKKCEEKIKEMPKNIKVRYCGLIDHSEVHKTFSQYDGFFFPTESENFGHVIAESLIVGCPVVISDQTPFTDVNENNAGWAYPLNNKEKIISAIQELVDINDHDIRQKSKACINYTEHKLNIEEIKAEYMNMLDVILKN